MLVVAPGLISCTLPRVTTVWQSGSLQPVAFDRILVAAITINKNDTLREALEQQFTGLLGDAGIDAISTYKEFGPGGFSFFAEEAAYVALCERGVDAVLTFAQTYPSYSEELMKGVGRKYSSVFYYNHIWNYRNLSDSLRQNTWVAERIVWECILFDLNSLEARSVMLVKSVDGNDYEVSAELLAKNVINKMIKEKVIQPKEKHLTHPKAF